MNEKIRTAARETGVCLWQIAEMENISEFTFLRRLRREFSAADTERILGHIAAIAAKRESGVK